MTTAPRFIAYYRVSTDKQGRSGLGSEVQRAAVRSHVTGARGAVAAEFVEVESGRKKDRPQLAAALVGARSPSSPGHRQAQPSGAQRPLYLRVDGERRRVRGCRYANRKPADRSHSCRRGGGRGAHDLRLPKVALAPAKMRGIRLGNPGLVAGSAAQARAANAVKTRRAQARASEVLPFIEQAHQAGALTLQQIANALAARGVQTPSGRSPRWHQVQVARIVGAPHPGSRSRKAAWTSASGAPLPASLKATRNLG